jgi:hypothetical protein
MQASFLPASEFPVGKNLGFLIGVASNFDVRMFSFASAHTYHVLDG